MINDAMREFAHTTNKYNFYTNQSMHSEWVLLQSTGIQQT